MNGILLVDKPKDCTSRDVVNKICKILGTKKVGHTGTLDPIASGVLVICVGKCLKLVEILTCDEKVYDATVVLGYETDTLDVTGNVVCSSNSDKIINDDDITRVLEKFVGVIEQEVPKYSAVRVNGKRLHEYARDGEDVILPKRRVRINSLSLESSVKKNDDGYLEFCIRCDVSKGTYIRSLIRDIGHSLGSYATMKNLRRIKQGNFVIDNSYTINDIERENYKLLNPIDVLNYKKVIVNDDMRFKIINGQVLDPIFDEEVAMIIDKDNELLAIYKRVGDKVRPWKMFKETK